VRKHHTSTFNALNASLMACADIDELRAWLEAEKASGCLYRALRVHGRLSAVRREAELKDIRRSCSKPQRRAA
jgi:hypothetical protein